MMPRGIAVLLGSLAISACSLESADCTAVGYQSSVRAVGTGPVEITEFCVEDVCLPDPSDPSGAGIPVSDEPGEYGYRLVFTSGTAETETAEGTVTTEAFRVNGPGCHPLTANATLTVNDNGEVEVSHP